MNFSEIIWMISPDETPVLFRGYGHRRLTRLTGSLRKRRRRLAKPVAYRPFIPSHARMHEWHSDLYAMQGGRDDDA